MADALPEWTQFHWFDVTAPECGAIGDGTTDDTAAIQRAIDACLANGGGTVFVPPGEYRCDAALTVFPPERRHGG